MEGEHRRQLLALVRSLGTGPLVGAEVGSQTATTSALLLRYLPHLTMYVVDTWAPPEESSPYWQSADPCARQTSGQQEAAYRCAVRNLQGLHARILRMPSIEAARTIADASMHFAFLDASHAEPDVAADIEAWLPKIRPGGLLCGHDYHEPCGIHTDGVFHAVSRFRERSGLRIETGRGLVWWCHVPDVH